METDPNIAIPLHNVQPRRTRSRGSTITKQEYTVAINAHVQQPQARTLYPGPIYEDLSRYLQKDSLDSRSTKIGNGSPDRPRSHACLYELQPDSWKRPAVFSDPDECVQRMNTNTSTHIPQLLFLRGLSSPQWLESVAASRQIDPEFLNSNMLFRCRRTYSAYPALPSAYDNIIRLTIVTIGCREDATWGSPRPHVVEKLKSQARRQMEQYQHELGVLGSNVRCGDSVVREFYVLGERHFLLEQEISIYVLSGNSAWSAVICTDVGNSLSEGPRGPWLAKDDLRQHANTTTFYPTIQHRKKVAFRSKSVDDSMVEDTERRFMQTASLLPLDYGRLHDRSAMAAHPFYALHELFRFAASSTNQALNLIEDYVRLETGPEMLENEKPSFANLAHYQDILDVYMRRLSKHSEIVRRRSGPLWPHNVSQDKPTMAKAEAAAEALFRDYGYLQERAHAIDKRCERGMNVLMNSRMLAETKQAYLLGSRNMRLTFIAFVYIPLSFTTSLFGMNLEQFGTGRIPVWVFIATSVPILLLTMLTFFLGSGGIAKGIISLVTCGMCGRSRRKVKKGV